MRVEGGEAGRAGGLKSLCTKYNSVSETQSDCPDLLSHGQLVRSCVVTANNFQ